MSLERFKTSECSESALGDLRREISRPAAMFDAKEATTILKGVTKDFSPPPSYSRAVRADMLLTQTVLGGCSVSQFRTLFGALVKEGVGPLFVSFLSYYFNDPPLLPF